MPTSRPHDAGRLAELQSGERQRAPRDELAGGNPDDARDREHQHQRQREQRVDRAVGDAVLREQRGDRQVHGRRSVAASGAGAGGNLGGRAATRLQARLASAYLISTHLPLSILTITRARLSRPLWSLAFITNTPCVPTTLEFSSASRSAARNSLRARLAPSSAPRGSPSRAAGTRPTGGRRTSCACRTSSRTWSRTRRPSS